AADLVGKLLCPALINGIGCSVLKRTGKQVTNGLDHGVGQADVEPAASGTQFNMEGGDQDDFVAAADAGKLGMHFGANVFVLDGVDLFPAFCIAVQGQGKQTLDDALLGRGEITAFYPGVVAAMTTKEAVNDEKQQTGIKGEQ